MTKTLVLLALLLPLVSLSAWAQKRTPTPTSGALRISVLDAGAKCDGHTDDTVALQSVIAQADTPPFAVIELPPSPCLFTQPLVFGGLTTRYSEISVEGHSEYTSSLVYRGTASPAILISHMSAFHWSGFSVSGPGSNGSNVGVQLDGPFGSGGTMDTTITFEHFNASLFHIGMLAGNGDAASEIDCRQCGFSRNDIGWTASGYNSLNFWFFGLHLSGNGVGVQLGGPWATDAPKIFGGDSAGNTVADFKMGNSFGQLVIDGFRAQIQPGSRFYIGACPQQCIIRSSSIIGTAGQPVMDITPDGSFLFQENLIQGQINLLPSGGTIARIAIDGTQVSEGTPGYPVIFHSGSSYRIRFTDNIRGGVWPASYYNDASGLWTQP